MAAKYGINYENWQDDLKRIVDFTTNYNIKDYNHSKEYSEKVINGLCHKGTHVEFDKKAARRILSRLNDANNNGSQSGAAQTRRDKIERIQPQTEILQLRRYGQFA